MELTSNFRIFLVQVSLDEDLIPLLGEGDKSVNILEWKVNNKICELEKNGCKIVDVAFLPLKDQIKTAVIKYLKQD